MGQMSSKVVLRRFSASCCAWKVLALLLSFIFMYFPLQKRWVRMSPLQTLDLERSSSSGEELKPGCRKLGGEGLAKWLQGGRVGGTLESPERG